LGSKNFAGDFMGFGGTGTILYLILLTKNDDMIDPTVYRNILTAPSIEKSHESLHLEGKFNTDIELERLKQEEYQRSRDHDLQMTRLKFAENEKQWEHQLRMKSLNIDLAKLKKQ
jgi:hypothetical protein